MPAYDWLYYITAKTLILQKFVQEPNLEVMVSSTQIYGLSLWFLVHRLEFYQLIIIVR